MNLKIREVVDNKIYHALTIDGVVSTTVREVKGTQAKYYGFRVHNPNAIIAWLQIFDKPANQVQLGVTSPTDTIKVGPDGSASDMWENPINMQSGFSIAATTTETGSTALTTGLSVNIFYK